MNFATLGLEKISPVGDKVLEVEVVSDGADGFNTLEEEP